MEYSVYQFTNVLTYFLPTSNSRATVHVLLLNAMIFVPKARNNYFK